MARKFELLSSLLNNTQIMFTKKYLMITAIALSLLVTLTIQKGSFILATVYAGDPEKVQVNKDETVGTISSIQRQNGDSPAWMLSGHWNTNLINKSIDDFNTNNASKFDATFSMVMLDGSAKHQHHISNFLITDVTDENDTISYKGLATVTLKDGPVTDVPTEIKIINKNVISIWFDPTVVKNHFGVSPIYGAVTTEEMKNKDVI